ncbi:GNAT family N-acetyltransferase [Mesorhizobium sp.]|uniref:GNAT family N-acetyltransferase n=1 Tax=Mesorhizobium sp. TaxID=1871066 RepID=UPI000FD23230|nr:GNAT family N-acetyltransferase [Mesorhizobium sp.]RUV80535.1 GNAT family N-acetyltransferase [Mesorhizobium sp. M5C.F.Ca.IN.020.14.1.1]RWI32029.1 MAG: GNAT family N-acetyltransferase [Mesorhizobium sp.]RWI61353.1 MAG: GNAT family N-acetyltransferase [Mesorhizobium sp.]RWJ22856.1 MAG: GNAT family N-acetyltransferase [Mesorhizobium sp.]TIQ70100.1 MAG: GNAT family N-acetyltransferase [Mesorhizobium sp.]
MVEDESGSALTVPQKEAMLMVSQSNAGGAVGRLFRATKYQAGAKDIWLCAVTSSDQSAIAELVLDLEQEQFAGSVEEVFNELQNSHYPQLEHPFAVVARGFAVGFFILREKQAVPAWAHADVVTLHSFRVCRDHQNKGYGRAGIELAAGWIRQNRPSVTQLMLAVNTQNVLAKTIYFKCGFDDTGTTHSGPIGDQNILTYDLVRQNR